jgi:hypothetical protein
MFIDFLATFSDNIFLYNNIRYRSKYQTKHCPASAHHLVLPLVTTYVSSGPATIKTRKLDKSDVLSTKHHFLSGLTGWVRIYLNTSDPGFQSFLAHVRSCAPLQGFVLGNHPF